MKKFVTLFGIALLLGSCAVADEIAAQPLEGSVAKTKVAVFSDEDNNFGLKDAQGNVIVEPEYKKMIKLGDAWIVQKKSKYGLMDSTGKYLIEPKYRHVDRILGKYVKLGNDNDFGIYNDKGETVIPPEYTSVDILFGGMFLTKKNYKYGVCDKNGRVILENKFDDIYMPKPNVMRIQYNGQWYEIEQVAGGEFVPPEDIQNIKDNGAFKVTAFVTDPVAASGYSAVTFTDYFLKIFSSITPAHEQTIDDLMLSQGADTVNIFIKFTWLPKYPCTFAKNYYHNLRTPNNGPLADVKTELIQKMQ